MTRLFRNPNIKVGDTVRIHAEPVRPLTISSIEPSPKTVGQVATVTAVLIYEHNTSLDYDMDYKLPNGRYECCDSQFLEVVE